MVICSWLAGPQDKHQAKHAIPVTFGPVLWFIVSISLSASSSRNQAGHWMLGLEGTYIGPRERVTQSTCLHLRCLQGTTHHCLGVRFLGVLRWGSSPSIFSIQLCPYKVFVTLLHCAQPPLVLLGHMEKGNAQPLPQGEAEECRGSGTASSDWSPRPNSGFIS